MASPKAMRAWGLDYESLRKVNPGLVMVSTCLNGQSGPHAMLAGYGTMAACLAGFGEMTGWPRPADSDTPCVIWLGWAARRRVG